MQLPNILTQFAFLSAVTHIALDTPSKSANLCSDGGRQRQILFNIGLRHHGPIAPKRFLLPCLDPMVDLRDILLGDCSAVLRGHLMRLRERREGSRRKGHQCHSDKTLHEIGTLDGIWAIRKGVMDVQERLDRHVCCKLNETILVSQRLLVRQINAGRFNDLVGFLACAKVAKCFGCEICISPNDLLQAGDETLERRTIVCVNIAIANAKQIEELEVSADVRRTSRLAS